MIIFYEKDLILVKIRFKKRYIKKRRHTLSLEYEFFYRNTTKIS